MREHTTKVVLSRKDMNLTETKSRMYWRRKGYSLYGLYDRRTKNITLFPEYIAKGHKKHDIIIKKIMLVEIHEVLHRVFKTCGLNDEAAEHDGMGMIGSRLVEL